MRRIALAWPLAAGVLALALITVAGCSRGEQKSAKPSPPPAAPPKQARAEDELRPSKLPAAEFQQPAALPPSEPLPKPALEPIGRSAESSNPLRAVAQPTTAAPDSRAGPKQLAAAAKEATPPPTQLARLTGRPQTAKNSGVAFDPIKEDGPIFDDWPKSKPKVALVITGMEEGYLEPCGCAGLDRMKGGMSRRASFLQELRRKKGWPVVALDVGGLVQGFGQQAVMKFHTAVDGKLKMGYNAITFGVDDLRLPAGEVLAVAACQNDSSNPFVSANVGLLGKPGENTCQTRVIDVGGMKIGVTAVLGKQYQKEIRNDEIEMSDPDAALEKILPELKQKANFLVLLAQATLDESIELGKKFPAFNVVVSSDGSPEPPKDPQVIRGTKTLLVTVGYKGQNAIVLGLFDDAKDPIRYQRVPLDSRFPPSDDMKMLMRAYQEQLKAIGFEGLGLREVPHPQAETNGRFIGSAKCESCHEKSYDIWRHSGHGHAYKTLADLDPPRNFDPECVSCHVTGWNPGKFFPYESGYKSLEKTPHLINVGCEDCHGPGEKHAKAEMGANDELQKKLRQAMVISKAESKKQQCYTCHDLDNSPEFDFDKYWPFVKHYEKDE